MIINIGNTVVHASRAETIFINNVNHQKIEFSIQKDSDYWTNALTFISFTDIRTKGGIKKLMSKYLSEYLEDKTAPVFITSKF